MNRRIILEVVVAIILVSMMVVLAVASYKGGYNRLEVDLVYAIAGDRNKFGG